MKREESGEVGNRCGSVNPGEAVPTGAQARGTGHPDFMLSLARGVQVARALARRKNPSTVSQLSLETGLSRSVVRRCLYTLTEIGLADRNDRRHFFLSAHIQWVADAPRGRWPRTLGNA
jgi:IclR family pca regulon transcriptional regulator